MDRVPAVKRTLRVAALFGIGAAAQATTVLFQDSFTVQGTQLDTSEWTTVTGDASFLGRTQLADWTTGTGQFVVGPNGAVLALDTYNPNPPGSSLYGTQAMTIKSFQPTVDTSIEFDTTLQLTSVQPGLVYGMYLYGCDPSVCATNHDEIDIELVTNSVQTGGQYMVELNRYADQPLGAGDGDMVALPSGFDPLAVHTWSIIWSSTSVSYLVDGHLLQTDTTFVPQGPMAANEIAWGPATDWPQAYSSSLEIAATQSQSQSFNALLTNVTVSEGTVAPEPGSWGPGLCGLVAMSLGLLRRP